MTNRDDRIRSIQPKNDRDTLERRLNDGYQRIERAREIGQDVTAWEDFWIDLLYQYEQACDLLPEAVR